MNFNEIWNQLLKKEPRLEENDFKIEFKSINLKRLLIQVYKKGQSSVPKEVENYKPYNPFDDIFGKFQ